MAPSKRVRPQWMLLPAATTTTRHHADDDSSPNNTASGSSSSCALEENPLLKRRILFELFKKKNEEQEDQEQQTTTVAEGGEAACEDEEEDLLALYYAVRIFSNNSKRLLRKVFNKKKHNLSLQNGNNNTDDATTTSKEAAAGTASNSSNKKQEHRLGEVDENLLQLDKYKMRYKHAQQELQSGELVESTLCDLLRKEMEDGEITFPHHEEETNSNDAMMTMTAMTNLSTTSNTSASQHPTGTVGGSSSSTRMVTPPELPSQAVKAVEDSQENLESLHVLIRTNLQHGYFRSAISLVHSRLLTYYKQAETKAAAKDEHQLLSLRTHLAGLWCLYAQVLWEVSLHTNTPHLQQLVYANVMLASECPLVGNHGWIWSALVRWMVLRADYDLATDLCYDGLDRAHGRNQHRRVATPPPHHFETYAPHWLAQLPFAAANDPISAHDLQDSVREVIRLPYRLMPFTSSTYYYRFADSRCASLLTHELNRISELREYQRLGSTGTMALPSPPPKNGVDAFPCFRSPPRMAGRKKAQAALSGAQADSSTHCPSLYGRVVAGGHGSHSSVAAAAAAAAAAVGAAPPPLLPPPPMSDMIEAVAATSPERSRKLSSGEYFLRNEAPHRAPGIAVDMQQEELDHVDTSEDLERGGGAQDKPDPINSKEEESDPVDNEEETGLFDLEEESEYADDGGIFAPEKEESSHSADHPSSPEPAAHDTILETKEYEVADGDDQYYMREDWVPTNPNGKQTPPQEIRTRLQKYMDKSRHNKTKILRAMGVNSNSLRKFLHKTYKDPWRATENGAYWAAARLLEAIRLYPDHPMDPDSFGQRAVGRGVKKRKHSDDPKRGHGGGKKKKKKAFRKHAVNIHCDDDEEYIP